jgi:hypothetical protein
MNTSPESYRYVSVLSEPSLCGIPTVLINSGELIPHLMGGLTDNVEVKSDKAVSKTAMEAFRTVTFSPQRIVSSQSTFHFRQAS